MSNQEIKSARSESYLRIQRKDVFGKIFGRDDYKQSGPGESTLFRKRLPRTRKERRTAEAQQELVALHLEEENKGYPEGFYDYQTYDERHNKNYKADSSKFSKKI